MTVQAGAEQRRAAVPVQPAQPPQPQVAQPPAPPQAPAPAQAPLYAAPVVKPHPPVERPKVPPKGAAKARRRGLTEFQRTAFRLFGNLFARRPVNAKLTENLHKARAGLRAEALQSAALLAGLIGAASGGMMAVFFLFVFVPLLGVELGMPFLLLIGLSPFLMGLGGYGAVLASPGARAKARGKDIDNRLPYALNYIAAMASAGVNVDTIFKSLGEQRIYGEVAREAEAIYRDIGLFGKDVVTAFKRAIARTPSQRFAELLQGAITTFGSGGDLQNYFSSKAQRYMVENRQVQKQYLDTMGLMAETYVTTAVAGPLFLMVMMAIMGLLSGGGPGQLYMVVYMMLPAANFGFVYGLMAMTPKV